MTATVHIVHCIDTEGPLRETLEQTFERLNAIFGLSLTPSLELLTQIQRGEADLGGVEAAAAAVVRPELLEYNDNWDAIGAMLDRRTSEEFRTKFRDDDGQGWVYNWFCCDHVGHMENPRGRAEGFHVVYDYYADRFSDTCDGIHFHYHPEAFNKRANSNATHWFANTPKLFDILARRIIDRGWFPAANRPGFHTERPDSHWFLEQFIPFDYANQRMRHEEGGEQPDLAEGRYGDWRRAPATWRSYRPAHDDYQIPGSCRRHIFRCLNVGTRFRPLNTADIEDAFKEAQETGVAVVGFTDHDFRDIGRDVKTVANMINVVRDKFPSVRVKNSEAIAAARACLDMKGAKAPKLSITRDGGIIRIEADESIFGPQPFLAVGARDGRRLHDAFDIIEPFRRWSYVLDDHTLPLDMVETVGIAATSPEGAVTVERLSIDDNKTMRNTYWGE